jgi:hypothetical protein
MEAAYPFSFPPETRLYFSTKKENNNGMMDYD